MFWVYNTYFWLKEIKILDLPNKYYIQKSEVLYAWISLRIDFYWKYNGRGTYLIVNGYNTQPSIIPYIIHVYYMFSFFIIKSSIFNLQNLNLWILITLYFYFTTEHEHNFKISV